MDSGLPTGQAGFRGNDKERNKKPRAKIVVAFCFSDYFKEMDSGSPSALRPE